MSKLIIITGELATGKSTLADSLSHSLNIPSIKKDVIKEKFCDEIGFSNREENRKLSIMAVDNMISIFEAYAKDNSDLILEANFRSDELLKIKTLADQFNVNVICLFLVGDFDLIYKRFLARVPSRHRAHLSQGLDKSFDKFVEYNNQLANQDICFNTYKIDISPLSVEEVKEKAISIVNS